MKKITFALYMTLLFSLITTAGLGQSLNPRENVRNRNQHQYRLAATQADQLQRYQTRVRRMEQLRLHQANCSQEEQQMVQRLKQNRRNNQSMRQYRKGKGGNN